MLKKCNGLKIRWLYLIFLLFDWLIPIVMLNEFVALTDISTGFKITFMGCLVLLFIFINLRKKIYAFIYSKPHGLLRGVLILINKLVTYLLMLGILWAIYYFSSKFYRWWLLSGISMIIGMIFLFLDEYFMGKKGVA